MNKFNAYLENQLEAEKPKKNAPKMLNPARLLLQRHISEAGGLNRLVQAFELLKECIPAPE